MSDTELYCGKTEFSGKGIMVNYTDQKGNTMGQRYWDEPHSLVKIIDVTELKV